MSALPPSAGGGKVLPGRGWQGGCLSPCPAEPLAHGQHAACSSASRLRALCGGRQLRAPQGLPEKRLHLNNRHNYAFDTVC